MILRRALANQVAPPLSLNAPAGRSRRRINPSVLDASLLASLALVAVICICLVWQTRSWTRATAEQTQLNVVDTLDSEINRTFSRVEGSVTRTARILQVPGVWEMPSDLRQAMLFEGSVAVPGLSPVLVMTRRDACGRWPVIRRHRP